MVKYYEGTVEIHDDGIDEPTWVYHPEVGVQHAADDRPERRAAVLRPEAGREDLAVVAAGRLEPADDGQLVGDLRLARHQLAELDAADVCLDGPELAAYLRRGVRLHVVQVHVARPAGQVDHDD